MSVGVTVSPDWLGLLAGALRRIERAETLSNAQAQAERAGSLVEAALRQVGSP